MMNKLILSAFLSFAFVFPALSQETSISADYSLSMARLKQMLSQETDPTASSESVPFTTIEQGRVSRFSIDNTPVQPIFNDSERWESFWQTYTKGLKNRPESPLVDFDSEIILVSPIGEISGVYINRSTGILYVKSAKENGSKSWPLAKPAFHIIKIEKIDFQTVVFERKNPVQRLAIGEETSAGVDIPNLDVARTPPACIELTQWNSWNWLSGWKSHATAVNRCGRSYRFRMIWAWAPDGACHSVRRRWNEERYGYIPYVSELRFC